MERQIRQPVVPWASVDRKEMDFKTKVAEHFDPAGYMGASLQADKQNFWARWWHSRISERRPDQAFARKRGSPRFCTGQYQRYNTMISGNKPNAIAQRRSQAGYESQLASVLRYAQIKQVARSKRSCRTPS